MYIQSESSLMFFIILSLSSFQDINASISYKNSIKSLLDYLKHESSISHVNLIIESDSKYLLEDKISLVQFLIKPHIPFLNFDYKRSTVNEDIIEAEKIRIHHHTDQSSLLIFTQFLMSAEQSNPIKLMVEPLDSLTQNPSDAKHPKCLFIIFTENERGSGYKVSLEEMWKDLLLDVTILEVSKFRKSQTLWEIIKEDSSEVRIHYFNPFTDEYTIEQYSTEIQWFPDKLKNLNGFKIPVSLIHRIPFAWVERNPISGHIITSSGTDIEIAKLFSKLMNFTLLMVLSKEDKFGRYSCDKNKTDGNIRQLLNHEVKWIIVNTVLPPICKNGTTKLSRLLTRVSRYKIVVPIMRRRIQTVIGIGKTFAISVLISILPLIVWSIFRLFKLNNSLELAFMVSQIILQTSVNESPRTVKRRVFFTYITIISLFHSSALLAGLTNTIIENKPEPIIKHYRDLKSLNISVVAPPNLQDIIVDFENLVTNLTDKRVSYESHEWCIERIVKKRDVACIMKEQTAETTVNTIKDRRGRVLLEILQGNINHVPNGYLLEATSPYVDYFTHYIMRLEQSGIKDKWDQDSISRMDTTVEKTTSTNNFVEDKQKQLRYVLQIIIPAGYLIPLIIFIAEIITKRK